MEIQNLPWTIQFASWPKNNDPEKEPNTRKNQGTARQIAITFYYLTKSTVLDYPSRTKRESAHFLEFFSGISYDRLEDKLRYKKMNQFMGMNSIEDVDLLKKDLKRVESFFCDFRLKQPLNFLKEDIIALEKLAIVMSAAKKKN